MKVRALLLSATVSLLPSCLLSSNMDGQWVGYLVMDYDGDDMNSGLDLRLTSNGKTFVGDAEMYFYGYYEIDGDVMGTVDGDIVIMTIEFDYDGDEFDMDLVCSREKNSMICTGEWEFYDYSVDVDELYLARM